MTWLLRKRHRSGRVPFVINRDFQAFEMNSAVMSEHGPKNGVIAASFLEISRRRMKQKIVFFVIGMWLEISARIQKSQRAAER
jgi:hypothetical protein